MPHYDGHSVIASFSVVLKSDYSASGVDLYFFYASSIAVPGIPSKVGILNGAGRQMASEGQRTVTMRTALSAVSAASMALNIV